MLKPSYLSILVGICLTLGGCALSSSKLTAYHATSTVLSAEGTTLKREFAHPAIDNLSGYHMLAVGLDGLAARLEIIEAAERSLDLQYYIFRNDESGSLIAQALLKAADRGVRVRLIMDDGESVKGDQVLFSLTANPNIQIRVYNPLDYRGSNGILRAVDFLLHKKRLDRRMHNKLLVADNSLALFGGRNVGDQYFQIDKESQFGDDDVAVTGPMVQRLSAVFDEFWNSPQSISAKSIEPKKYLTARALEAYRQSLPKRHRQAIFDSDLNAKLEVGEPLADLISGKAVLSWAPAQLVYDSPDKSQVLEGKSKGSLIYGPIDDRTGETMSDLMMITPYFVPSTKELALLKAARQRGVSVRILTNSLIAAPAVTPHAGYTHYRRALLENGVELHEIRALVKDPKGTGQSTRMSRHGNYALHAKLYVFDSKSMFAGSMNFDQRSRRLNTEIGLIIESEELAHEAATRFNSLTELENAYWVSLDPNSPGQLTWKTEEDGIVKEYAKEPARSWWQRFRTRVMALLPLDREL